MHRAAFLNNTAVFGKKHTDHRLKVQVLLPAQHLSVNYVNYEERGQSYYPDTLTHHLNSLRMHYALIVCMCVKVFTESRRGSLKPEL